MIRTLLIMLLFCVAPLPGRPQAHAQEQPAQSGAGSVAEAGQKADDPAEPLPAERPAMFSTHLIADRYWVSGQANFIFQAHGPFHSPYEGTNSFTAPGETANSRVLTLYTGVKLRPYTQILFDLEETGGGGLSTALGLAGFTNLDVVRNPELGQGVYLARIMLNQIFPLDNGSHGD